MDGVTDSQTLDTSSSQKSIAEEIRVTAAVKAAKRPAVPRSRMAGLKFPVGRLERYLRRHSTAERVSGGWKGGMVSVCARRCIGRGRPTSCCVTLCGSALKLSHSSAVCVRRQGRGRTADDLGPSLSWLF